jgi:hypothetical protein
MLKELQKPSKRRFATITSKATEEATPIGSLPDHTEEKMQKFIAQGGTLAKNSRASNEDHRLTLRIPKWLLDKIDIKRKERVGVISRNLWILEQVEKAIDSST